MGMIVICQEGGGGFLCTMEDVVNREAERSIVRQIPLQLYTMAQG